RNVTGVQTCALPIYGTPITNVIATAHKDNLFHPLHNARLFADRHRDISEPTGWHKRHRFWLMTHNGIDNQINSVTWIKRQFRLRSEERRVGKESRPR